MPIRDGKEVPEFLRHYGTTWLIISQNKEAFVMNCGSPGILKDIQGIKAKGGNRRRDRLVGDTLSRRPC